MNVFAARNLQAAGLLALARRDHDTTAPACERKCHARASSTQPYPAAPVPQRHCAADASRGHENARAVQPPAAAGRFRAAMARLRQMMRRTFPRV